MLKVLMLGTDRNVKGGITSVVNNYYKCGIDKKIKIKYIETVNDKNNILKILKMIKGFIEFILNINNYDIVHIHMASRWSTYRKSIYVRISKILKKKVILHLHGAEFDIFYQNECNDIKKKYIKKTFLLSDKIIVLSDSWKRIISNITDESKIEILNNATTVPKNLKKNLNTNKFLFLGKLGKRKGIYDLIEVFELLLKENNNLKLYIGGNGEVKKVKNIIKTKKLEKNIKVMGWLKGKEKENLLKECTFYVLPSYHEGMPVSIIEAMSYKNVTISTNVGGIPDIINNEHNGMLIEPGDNKQLYDIIKKLINNKELRLKLSNNGYKTIKEKFNIENNLEKLVNLYNNLYI